MALRFAAPTDAAALLRIYEAYIATPITFEDTLPSEHAFAQRIREISAVYPYLVWTQDDEICGYAYAHRFRERAAYGWSAELSVYLAPAWQSQGIGKRLYAALMTLLRLQGVTMLYGGVTTPNPKSEGLHLSMGFSPVGTFHHAGYKCGAWHDVSWFECAIGGCATTPTPLAAIGTLPVELVGQVLTACCAPMTAPALLELANRLERLSESIHS